MEPNDTGQANAALLPDSRIVAAALALAPQQGRIIALLLKNPIVSNEMLATGGVKGDVTTAMRRLRIRLDKHKIGIRSHYALGYSLSPDDRQKIVGIVRRFTTPVAA